MKKLFVILLALLTTFSVFANSATEAPAAAAPEVAQEEAKVSHLPDFNAKPAGKMKIIVWTSLTGNARTSVMQCADAFNAAQSDFEVEIQYTSNIYTKMLTSTPAERPDIVHATGNESSRYNITVGTDNQLIIPVQEYIDYDKYDMSDIITNLQTNVVRNGEWYGIPVGNTSVGFNYNLDILEANGIDFRTLDSYVDIYEAGLKLKAAGIEHPILLRFDSADMLNFGLIAEGLNWFNYDNGRSGVPTKVLFKEDPEVKAAVLSFLDTVDKMRQADLLWPTTYLATDQRNMFSKGEIPIMASWISTYNAQWTLCQETGLRFSYAVHPTFRQEITPQAQGAGGAIFYIANTENAWKEFGSWQFLKFMMKDEWVCDFAIQSGYVPITVSGSQQPRYQEYLKNENPWAQDVIDAQQASRTDTSIPQIPFEKDYGAAFEYVFKKFVADKTYTIEQAFEDLYEQTTDAIEMYWLEQGVIL